MRHTTAPLWLASGEVPEWIARQLGHTTTEMLFRTYSRFVPNLTRQDGSAFARLLTQSFASRLPQAPVVLPNELVSSQSGGESANDAPSAPPGQPPPVACAATYNSLS